MIGMAIFVFGVMPAALVAGERVALWPLILLLCASGGGFMLDAYLGF